MEKPIRHNYGSLKISSSDIEAKIESIFFIFYLRWLLVGYSGGFLINILIMDPFNSFIEFIKYTLSIGSVFSIVLLIISYLIFRFRAKKKKRFLELEMKQAVKYENAIREWRIETLESEPLYWYKYSGLEFEQAVFSLFGKIGWKVSRTFVTGDGGINISGTDGLKKIKIICPQTKVKVDISHLRNALAIKLENDIDDIFILASPIGFTVDSTNLAKKNNIIILDPENLAKLAQGQFNTPFERLKVI